MSVQVKLLLQNINMNGNHIGIMYMLNKAEHNLYDHSYNACGDALSIILSDSNFCDYIARQNEVQQKSHTTEMRV